MFCIKGKAMNNETDLDWLARNVHEWREGANYVCVNHTDGGYVFHEHDRNCAIWFTKDQWLSRRAELQNKPSWKDAPEWAEWRAQDECGMWYWYAGEPIIERYVFDSGSASSRAVKGEVLGDWRDTLEKRSEEFKQFTSIEDNQEQVMTQQQEIKQNNGWFERGDLPPVGCECEILGAFGHYQEWFPCKIIAEHSGSVFAANERAWINVKHGERKFRPLRTERDELIEIISSSLLVTTEQVADAIIAAGFKLEAK